MALAAYIRRSPSLRPLATRDFRLLLAGSTIVSLIMPLHFLTQTFWITDRFPDRSVLYVGLLAASRGSAMLIMSLVGGAIADRVERRKVLLVCESVSVCVAGVVAVLMLTEPFGGSTIWAILMMSFVSSGTLAVDMPARSASIPAIVGMDQLAPAIGLQQIFVQLMIPISLPMVGLLNSLFEPGHIYAGSLAAWLLILPLISMLRYRSKGGAGAGRGFIGNIVDGMKYTRREPTVFAVISLVVVMQVIGMPGVATLGPVWMTKVLGLSKAQFGIIAMTWGLGAFVGSFFFGHQSHLLRRGSTLCVTVLLFCCSAIVFAHSRFVPLTALANFTLGVGMVGTMVCATTICQHAVSEDMRGRVMGLFPLAMGASMLGAAPVSALGQQFGLPIVVAIASWTALSLSFLIIAGRPTLRRTRLAAMEASPHHALVVAE